MPAGKRTFTVPEEFAECLGLASRKRPEFNNLEFQDSTANDPSCFDG